MFDPVFGVDSDVLAYATASILTPPWNNWIYLNNFTSMDNFTYMERREPI